jgi:PEP-CTERM motif
LKLRQLFRVFLLVCVATVTVRADEVPDGLIKMGRGSDPSPIVSFCQQHFTIQLNPSGGGIQNCINTSGVDWIGLDITAIIPPNTTPICIAVFFTNCTTTESPIGNSGNELVNIIFFGGTVITPGSHQTKCNVPPPQVAPQSCFFLNFNNGSSDDPLATGGWLGLNGARGGIVRVDAITAPEPGTIFLMIAGLGVLSQLRRKYAFS